MATLRLSTAVTRRRGARWRCGARIRELHPQVRAARGGSSSHLIHGVGSSCVCERERERESDLKRLR
ncbi:unnamed protein product [Spirodela intermedia]|uniref:Uncharacterized protein n=1 Tax=Spirodela intermedia TaxID=51605 RepID=A0ABN7E9S8_SPIIN|nr:unnamed protein product [Spirodela intermedia]